MEPVSAERLSKACLGAAGSGESDSRGLMFLLWASMTKHGMKGGTLLLME